MQTIIDVIVRIKRYLHHGYNKITNNVKLVTLLLSLITLGVTIPVIITLIDIINFINISNSTYNTLMNMDTATLTLILSVSVLVITNLANPIHYRRHKRLLNFIQEVDTNNTNRFQSLSNKVQRTEDTLKFYIVEKDINTSLRKVTNDALIYITDKDHAEVISALSREFISFALNVHNTGIGNYTDRQLGIEIASLYKTSTHQICRILSSNSFCRKVDTPIHNKLNEYENKILSIIKDNIQNSKMDRFRATSETILQEFLSIIVINSLSSQPNTQEVNGIS